MKITLIALIMTLSLSVFAIPNPSAVNCEQSGGEYKVLQSHDGHVGTCRVGSGLIGSWTLLKEIDGTKTVAVGKFFNKKNVQWSGYGNPAAHYCTEVGGRIKVYESEGGESGFCFFYDGSFISQWTLYLGAEEHKELADLLSQKF